MATRLKDFVSHYDTLEIPAECTKVGMINYIYYVKCFSSDGDP